MKDLHFNDGWEIKEKYDTGAEEKVRNATIAFPDCFVVTLENKKFHRISENNVFRWSNKPSLFLVKKEQFWIDATETSSGFYDNWKHEGEVTIISEL